MLDKNHQFSEIIERDRANTQSEDWRGTFIEYLERLKDDSSVCNLSHARVYEVIIRDGSSNLNQNGDSRIKRILGDDSLKIYNFFKDDFFGIERTLSQIVRYFHSAALIGEESRQVLYLMGPVGAGKSSIMAKLQQGLETADPVYAIDG